MKATEFSARPLSAQSAVRLAELVEACRASARIRIANDDGSIIAGTCRCIGDQNGNFAGSADDIRDAWLRVTTDMGFELFMPVAEAVAHLNGMTIVLGGER